MLEMPKPLVPRHLRFDVPQRTLVDGEHAQELDEAYVEQLARELGGGRRRGGGDLLFCTALPTRRTSAAPRAAVRARRAGDARVDLVRSCPGDSRVRAHHHHHRQCVCAERASNAICASLKRACGAWVSAAAFSHAVERRHRHARHRRRASRCGCSNPARPPARWPRRTYGSAAGHGDLLSFDMGGTTAKICVIDQGQPADRPRIRGRPASIASKKAAACR